MSMFYVYVSSMGDFLVPAMLCYGPTDPLPFVGHYGLYFTEQ